MPKSQNPLKQHRARSTLFATAQRRKALARDEAAKDAIERLHDFGLVSALVPPHVAADPVSLIRWIRAHTFDDIPDRASGLSSTRIAELLGLRRALPPIVSLAQLHARSVSATDLERGIARLVAQGVLRRVVIPGRGKGGAAVGEGVVVVEDWKQSLRLEPGVDEAVKQKYLALLDAYPTSLTAPVDNFSSAELQNLVQMGYFTNPGALLPDAVGSFSRPSGLSSPGLASAGSSHASGTLAAVGGSGAVLASGGSGSTLATQNRRTTLPSSSASSLMTFSLPSMGLYLKLLIEARLHLLHLLRQLSPRFREATQSLLDEKWTGNVLDDAVSKAKRARGEWSGVLPGKTKRWRDLAGLRFEWVLAECNGAGLVELFDTRSVGTGVRAL